MRSEITIDLSVLKGVGSSSDGRSKSVYAPLPQGQAKNRRHMSAQTSILQPLNWLKHTEQPKQECC